MPDIVSGSQVYGRDMPPSQYDQDWTTQANISSTSYITGTPEVGVNFTAPTSGRVLVAVGGGIRNNAAAAERGIITYILYENSSDGDVVTSASAYSGVTSQGFAASQEFHYVGGFNMEENLVPGRNYYAQVVHRCLLGNGTLDIASRDIAVIPLT